MTPPHAIYRPVGHDARRAVSPDDSMAGKTEELTAIFLRERLRWENTIIAECEPPPETNGNGHATAREALDAWMRPALIVKAQAEPNELVANLSYRFYCHWTNYKNPRTGVEERQFLARTFVRCQPHGQAGVVRYLMQCPHVGQATARRLWERFGGDAVRILRESPDVAAAAVGGQFSQAKAEEAAAFLAEEQGMEGCTLELMDLLGGRGFPRDLGKRAVREWGNEAARLVKQNPYLLMRFRGCGFLRTDKLYLDLGGDPGRLKRQTLCAWHAIAQATASAGHTWHPTAIVVDGLRGQVGGAEVRAVPAATLGKRAGMLAARKDAAGKVWLADARKAASEAYIAERVAAMVAEKRFPCQWPDLASLADLSEHQRERAAAGFVGPLTIIGGSPGTGKTFLAARVIGTLMADLGHESVGVCAPTGKAAVRITEALAGYGIDARARTIHSMLGVQSRNEGDGWGFRHNEDEPLPFRVIVGDEQSMTDADLMASLLRAVAPGTQLLLVGDIHQLPPVGHGAPLRDLIAAGVPYAELREIRRNSGSIVEACAAIRDGRPFHTDGTFDPPAGRNLKLVSMAGPQQTLERALGFLRTVKARGLADPVWDCQVLVAVNARSELSRKAVNELLQRELNPAGTGVKGSPFRTGDKVICLKNGFVPVADDTADGANQDAGDDGKVYVANGEIGRVLQVEPRLTYVRLEAPLRVVKIPRGDGGGDSEDGKDDDGTDTGCTWDLAYAVTTHKMQGSECPYVLVLGDEYPGARQVCSREWLYTAISRGKRGTLLFGKRATFDGMIRRPSLDKRKTFLADLIREARP